MMVLDIALGYICNYCYNCNMINKLDYCYHSHTSRCGHATGEDEEYVINAIKRGFKRFGISDHIFLPGISQPRVRGSFECLGEYLDSCKKLKEKYKDQIEIVIGFEAEYLPAYLSYYKELLSSKKIDYLILGQHYHEIDGKLALFAVEEYVEDVIKGVESGLFTYLAHPDLFLLVDSRWNESNILAARRILEACEKYCVPIEINVCGLRSHRPYPSKDFFELSKEYNVEYVIGVDAHSPDHFSDGYIEQAIEFANKLGLPIKDLFIESKIK